VDKAENRSGLELRVCRKADKRADGDKQQSSDEPAKFPASLKTLSTDLNNSFLMDPL